jgi:hypothetical protein
VSPVLAVVVVVLGAVGAGLAVGAGIGLLLRPLLPRRKPPDGSDGGAARAP